MADSQTATSAPDFKSAHFIGIGGAGMSGIALVLHERGYVVTGSDLKTSRYIRQLTRGGVKVHVGHEAATIDEVKPDVVVVSTAIPESNPELVRARELGIPVWPRAKMLSALGHGYTTIAKLQCKVTLTFAIDILSVPLFLTILVVRSNFSVENGVTVITQVDEAISALGSEVSIHIKVLEDIFLGDTTSCCHQNTIISSLISICHITHILSIKNGVSNYCCIFHVLTTKTCDGHEHHY